MAYEYARENNLFEDVIYLCEPVTTIDKYGVVQHDTVTKREIYARIGSLYAKEFYAAHSSGIKGALKFVVNRADWTGDEYVGEDGECEPLIEYDGRYYTIYRAYLNGDDIELYGRRDLAPWTNSFDDLDI